MIRRAVRLRLPPLYRGDPSQHYSRVARAGLTPLRGTRLGGTQFVVGALVSAAVLPLSPPTAAIGQAGWVAAVAMLVVAVVVGAAMARARWVTPRDHLAAMYLGVVMIAAITWLAGGAGSPYTTLLVFSAGHAAVHPPRQIALFLATVSAAALAPLVYGDATSANVAFSLIRLTAILGVAAGLMYLIGNVYADDMRLRAETHAARAEAEQAAKLAARLRELDQLKDAFVSNVSHELRTPLTLIKGYLEALVAGEAGELKRRAARVRRGREQELRAPPGPDRRPASAFAHRGGRADHGDRALRPGAPAA